jgi:hypothetical protein
LSPHEAGFPWHSDGIPVPEWRRIGPPKPGNLPSPAENLSYNASKLLFFLANFPKDKSKPLARSRSVGLLS